MKFDIKKYGAYFHDGSLIAVERSENDLILSLESAQISLDEMQEKIVLSDCDSKYRVGQLSTSPRRNRLFFL